MQKILEKFFLIEKYFLGYLLFQMVAVIFIATFFRYTGLYSMSWGEELARYTMVWLGAVGSGIGSYYGLHFNVDVLVIRLPYIFQKICLFGRITVLYIFCSFLTYYGFYVVKRQIAFGQISPALKIPMWIMYSAIPVVAIMLLFHYTGYSLNILKEINKKIENEKKEKSGGGK